MAKTIIISNRLPLTIQKKDGTFTYSESAGGLATGLGSIYKTNNMLWVGWPGINLKTDAERIALKIELLKENLFPIFLTDKDIENYYVGFSNKTIWPIYHYFTQYASFHQDLWLSYKKVNRVFCDEIVKLYKPGDIIWVHDYQQLMLSSYLRQKLPQATIGFFQHIPFPSYEVFRSIPWREEILKGYLGADLIGFHTYDDARHFFSCLKRILGIENNLGKIEYDQRTIHVDAFPMGIDFEKFNSSATEPDTLSKVLEYKTSLGDRKLILSIDRLDYSKGIPQRLMAYESFLEKYPEYHSKIILVQLTVPSRYDVSHYRNLKIEIDELVGRINGKFGKINWMPIHYIFRAIPFTHLSALYAISDVALITPIRDGMNLVSKEYVATRSENNGVLILSEMTGAAKELIEALVVNPNDKEQLITALKKALTMSKDEQKKRMSSMRNTIRAYNVHNWLDVFMSRLAFTKELQKDKAAKLLSAKNNESILKAYKKAERRLILLDYDGTLMPFFNNPYDAQPDKELCNILDLLTADDKNKVVIISGRDKNTLSNFMDDFNVDLVAEHGIWYKKGLAEWKLSGQQTEGWKKEIMPFLKMYVARTPGTFIEEKDYSLVWHFRKTDSEFGEMRASELMANLNYLTAQMNLQLLEGNKVVEIKDAKVNKGKVAQLWLEENYEFVVAIGDDRTDEDMFKFLPKSGLSIKVGHQETSAKYSVSNYQDVRELLLTFITSIE